jgi:cation transport ATPase
VAGASLIVSGHLVIRAHQSVVQTQVARLAAAVNQVAQTPTPLQQTGATLANDLAAPLLGLGILAALAGAPMSGATLLNARFGEDVQWLAPLTVNHFLHLACQERIWIKTGAALQQLPKVDALVLTQAPTHWSTATIQALRARGIKAIYGLSPTPLPPTAETAGAPDLDALFIEDDPAAQGQLLAGLRRRHPHLGLVGDQQTDAALWSAGALTLAFGAFPTPALTPAAVQMDGELQKLCRLLDLARSLETNLTTSFGLTLLAGFVSLAGALSPGGGLALSIGAEHLALLAGLYNAIHPIVVPTDGLYPVATVPVGRRQRRPAPTATRAAPGLSLLFSRPTLAPTVP